MANRQRCRQASNAYNNLTPAEKATFDLLDWYFANVGGSDPDRALQRIATWLDVDWRIFQTQWWRTRSTPDLARLDDLAVAAGFWTMTGAERDAKKWEIVAGYLGELGA